MAETLDGLLDDCRSMLDESSAGNWTDAELVKWCNEGLTLMARGAQCIRGPIRFPTQNGVGEYALIVDATDIYSVKLHDGSTLHTLVLGDENLYKNGTQRTSDIPRTYWLRLYSSMLTYMSSTADIVPVGVKSLKNEDLKVILGLDPIPSVDGYMVTVDAALPHPKLKKGTQRVLLPDGFSAGASEWAVAKALMKEKYYDEAKFHFDMHGDYLDKLKEYMAQGSRTGHGKMKIVDDEYSGGWSWSSHGVILPND